MESRNGVDLVWQRLYKIVRAGLHARHPEDLLKWRIEWTIPLKEGFGWDWGWFWLVWNSLACAWTRFWKEESAHFTVANRNDLPTRKQMYRHEGKKGH